MRRIASHYYTSDHPENCKYRKRIDEKAIQDLDMTIDEWGCDPWDLSYPTLRSMQSGFPAPPEGVGITKNIF